MVDEFRAAADVVVDAPRVDEVVDELRVDEAVDEDDLFDELFDDSIELVAGLTKDHAD